jgi:hypothetical protein
MLTKEKWHAWRWLFGGYGNIYFVISDWIIKKIDIIMAGDSDSDSDSDNGSDSDSDNGSDNGRSYCFSNNEYTIFYE